MKNLLKQGVNLLVVSAIILSGVPASALAVDVETIPVVPNPSISLNALVADVITEGSDLTFSGNVTTPESGTKMVDSYIYAGFGCDSEAYDVVTTSMVEESEYDLTFSDVVAGLTAGEYSIQSNLVVAIPDEEEIVATSQCLDFTVEPEVVATEGSLTISKTVESYEGTWSFDYSGDLGEFNLTNDSEYDEGVSTSRTFDVLTGEVTITEGENIDWTMSAVECHYEVLDKVADFSFATEAPTETSPLVSFDPETRTFVVLIGEGDQVYCDVTNTYTPVPRGYLYLAKAVQNYLGEWSFGFEGLSGEVVTLSGYSGPEEEFIKKRSSYYTELLAGEHVITEVQKDGWRIAAVTCEYNSRERIVDEEGPYVVAVPEFSWTPGSNTFTVTVNEDEDVFCTVTNEPIPEEVVQTSGTRVGGRGSSKLPKAPTAPVVALTTEAPTCQPLLSAYMRMGWNNDSEEVKKLQNFLNEYDFMVPVTGYFGPLTDAAVRAFQAKYLSDVLTPWSISESTGFVYKTTRYKINNLVCPGSEAMPTL